MKKVIEEIKHVLGGKQLQSGRRPGQDAQIVDLGSRYLGQDEVESSYSIIMYSLRSTI